MLKHPTLEKLQALKLTGMVAALIDQMALPDSEELAFEERLGLLVDREITERDNRRLTSRLRRARLRHNAALEDIDYHSPRGLDKGLIQSLAACLNPLIRSWRIHRKGARYRGLRAKMGFPGNSLGG